VFASGNDRTALLRLPDGRVTRVRRGDNVEGWTVSSIDDSTVRLTGRSGARTLRVPTR
jgi:type IV pilus biogenesis protein PilP